MARKKCVLLFSGGRDSSLACIELAKQDYTLYLLTFDNGAILNLNYSNQRYKELKKLLPNKIKSRIVLPSFGLFKEISLKGLENDFSKYKKNLICMGCKLTMHVLSLSYCIEKNIKNIADGYTEYQKDYMEQRPEVISEIKKLHSEFGVRYLNPVYDVTDVKEIKKRLMIAGLSPESMEGSCLFGDTFSVPSTEILMAYLKEKIELCRPYMNKFTKKDEILFTSKSNITTKGVTKSSDNL